MTKRIRPERDVLDDLYSIQKISPKKIAKLYNVNQRTVQKWLGHYQIPRTHLNYPKIKPDEAQLRQWYLKENWTLPQIASYCGVSYPAVRAWFLKYGIPRRSNSEAQCLYRGTQELTKELLEKLYWAENMSQYQIAESFGVVQGAIKEKMKRFNIPTRGTANRGSRNGMYGKTHTKEAVSKIKEANRRQFSTPEAREKAAINSARIIAEGRTKKTHTKPERVFAELLDDLGTEYIWQYRVGRYVYDFYLPDTNILIEVHGTFWHADPRFYDHSNLKPIQSKNVANDVKKKDFALKKGFRYLSYWEYDIINTKPVMLNTLANLI